MQTSTRAYGSRQPGHYVLAAAIVDDDQADVLRHMLRSLIPRRAARFHWHEVPAANRLEMCHVLASTGLRHVVVVATPLDPKRQERVCLSATSRELNDQGVYRLQLETRRQRDAKDRRFLLGEQRANRLLALQYRFGHPNQEPLLWFPDAVAGAVAAALAAGETRYAGSIREKRRRPASASASAWDSALKSPELRESRKPAIPREVPASLPKA